MNEQRTDVWVTREGAAAHNQQIQVWRRGEQFGAPEMTSFGQWTGVRCMLSPDLPSDLLGRGECKPMTLVWRLEERE